MIVAKMQYNLSMSILHFGILYCKIVINYETNFKAIVLNVTNAMQFIQKLWDKLYCILATIIQTNEFFFFKKKDNYFFLKHINPFTF